MRFLHFKEDGLVEVGAEQEAADVVSRAEQLRGEAAAIFFPLR